MLKWDQKYSVNIDKFDRAHEELFALINDMSDTMTSDSDRDKMVADAKNLRRFLQIHFVREERLMADFEVINRDEHKNVHDGVYKRIEEALSRLRENKTGAMTEMVSFLKDWLPDHIVKMDMQYGRVVYARTANAPESQRIPTR